MVDDLYVRRNSGSSAHAWPTRVLPHLTKAQITCVPRAKLLTGQAWASAYLFAAACTADSTSAVGHLPALLASTVAVRVADLPGVGLGSVFAWSVAFVLLSKGTCVSCIAFDKQLASARGPVPVDPCRLLALLMATDVR
jgi:hypothetical protein